MPPSVSRTGSASATHRAQITSPLTQKCSNRIAWVAIWLLVYSMRWRLSWIQESALFKLLPGQDDSTWRCPSRSFKAAAVIFTCGSSVDQVVPVRTSRCQVEDATFGHVLPLNRGQLLRPKPSYVKEVASDQVSSTFR
ncbi:MAG: hypothetical protein ACLVEJ_01035 [Parabacteroides sp.]